MIAQTRQAMKIKAEQVEQLREKETEPTVSQLPQQNQILQESDPPSVKQSPLQQSSVKQPSVKQPSVKQPPVKQSPELGSSEPAKPQSNIKRLDALIKVEVEQDPPTQAQNQPVVVNLEQEEGTLPSLNLEQSSPTQNQSTLQSQQKPKEKDDDSESEDDGLDDDLHEH